MRKDAFFALAVFTILLFGGLLYLFFKPAGFDGWIAYFVMLLMNPGILLGVIASEVDW